MERRPYRHIPVSVPEETPQRAPLTFRRVLPWIYFVGIVTIIITGWWLTAAVIFFILGLFGLVGYKKRSKSEAVLIDPDSPYTHLR